MLEPYIRERESYIRFLDWENNQLLIAMRGEGITLSKNFYAAVEFLKNTEINMYDFPELDPVALPDDSSKGA